MLSPPNVVVELTESPDSSASVWEPSFPYEYGLPPPLSFFGCRSLLLAPLRALGGLDNTVLGLCSHGLADGLNAVRTRTKCGGQLGVRSDTTNGPPHWSTQGAGGHTSTRTMAVRIRGQTGITYPVGSLAWRMPSFGGCNGYKYHRENRKRASISSRHGRRHGYIPPQPAQSTHRL